MANTRPLEQVVIDRKHCDAIDESKFGEHKRRLYEVCPKLALVACLLSLLTACSAARNITADTFADEDAFSPNRHVVSQTPLVPATDLVGFCLLPSANPAGTFPCINQSNDIHRKINNGENVTFSQLVHYSRTYMQISDEMCGNFVERTSIENHGVNTLVTTLRQLATAGLGIFQNGAGETYRAIVIGATALDSGSNIVSSANASYTSISIENIRLRRQRRLDAIVRRFEQLQGAISNRLAAEAQPAAPPSQTRIYDTAVPSAGLLPELRAYHLACEFLPTGTTSNSEAAQSAPSH